MTGGAVARLPRVMVTCRRDRYDAVVIHYGYAPVERLSSPATDAGRRDLIGWLRAVAPVSEAEIVDPYGAGEPLAAGLRQQGWIVHVRKPDGPCTVFVDCYPDRYDVKTSLSAGSQRTTLPATAEGNQALVGWLTELGPVRRVIVYDADQDSVHLAAALTDAGFPVRVERATRGRLVAPPGEIADGIQVQLALQGLGWLEMHLRINAVSVALRGSYMSDAWQNTLAALSELLDGATGAQVVWVEEPGAHRFEFHSGASGALTVRLFHLADDMYGTATPMGGGDLVLDERMRLTNLATAFASASRKLLAAVPDIDVRARWPYGPPLHELQEIQARLHPDRR